MCVRVCVYVCVCVQEYQLVITGHSLGGGVAAVLALLMQEDNKYCGLQCFAFSPPGGLMRFAASIMSFVLLSLSIVDWSSGKPVCRVWNIARAVYAVFFETLTSFICFAVSALTLLVGRQDEHPAGKIWLMMCCCGYLSGAMCRLFACGPADATAFTKPHRLMPHLNPNWFYLSGTWLTQVVMEKRLLNGCCSSVIWALLLTLLSAIVRLSNVW